MTEDTNQSALDQAAAALGETAPAVPTPDAAPAAPSVDVALVPSVDVALVPSVDVAPPVVATPALDLTPVADVAPGLPPEQNAVVTAFGDGDVARGMRRLISLAAYAMANQSVDPIAYSQLRMS